MRQMSEIGDRSRLSIDNQPAIWSVRGMKKIGIFEAKNRFSSLCESISKGGRPVLVEKRGRPMVVISPAPPSAGQEREDILTAWRDWRKAHPDEGAGDYPEVWTMRSDRAAAPVDPVVVPSPTDDA